MQNENFAPAPETIMYYDCTMLPKTQIQRLRIYTILTDDNEFIKISTKKEIKELVN